MADDRICEEIITEFFLSTCRLRRRLNGHDLGACRRCLEIAGETFRRPDDVEYGYITLITGSLAELYIEPMLWCVGDVAVMCHRSNQLAIPVGYTPPTQLPGEFGSHVEVYEIVNSKFPGYVYLWLSYLLTECVNDDKYNAVQCERLLATNGSSDAEHRSHKRHGPALVNGQCVGAIDVILYTELVHIAPWTAYSACVVCCGRHKPLIGQHETEPTAGQTQQLLVVLSATDVTWLVWHIVCVDKMNG